VEDSADFNDPGLVRYDVVVWLSTDGEVMTEPGRQAFQRYICVFRSHLNADSDGTRAPIPK